METQPYTEHWNINWEAPGMYGCGLCNQWMPIGTIHDCPNIPQTTDQRIASALERIAAHHDRMEAASGTS